MPARVLNLPEGEHDRWASLTASPPSCAQTSTPSWTKPRIGLVLTQILSDMKDAIAQARTQVAEMIAQEKLFQGDMEKNQAQAQEWARKAELALGRGSEELAKEALRRKVDYDRNASSYMQQLIAQQQVVTKLKSDLNALQSKYDSAMRNRESMIARHKAAMAQQKIAATAQQLSAIDPSSEIARMDAKIRLEEARRRRA